MTSIYDQHDSAFAGVSAWVILDTDTTQDRRRRAATIAIKYNPSGVVWAYVHWLGTRMVRAKAGGYGYDKQGAALSGAARRLELPESRHITEAALAEIELGRWRAFRDALSPDDGQDWRYRLEDAGFAVLQAV